MFCFILTPLLMCLMFCFSFPPFICFASRPHLFSISLSFPLYSSLCFQLLCQFVCSCLVSPVFLFRFPVSDLHSIFPGLVVLLDSLSLVFFFLIIIIFFVCLQFLCFLLPTQILTINSVSHLGMRMCCNTVITVQSLNKCLLRSKSRMILKMGLVQPMSTDYSCTNVVITTKYSWVGTSSWLVRSHHKIVQFHVNFGYIGLYLFLHCVIKRWAMGSFWVHPNITIGQLQPRIQSRQIIQYLEGHWFKSQAPPAAC